MRNYIILNGNNSNTISGLLIQSLPPISKPLMRTAIEEIDGRDGDIVTNLGYSAYDKEVSIGLYGSYDVDEVIKYFSDNMTGQVTFSNEPDKYYNYEIINQIDFERLIRFKTAIVTLHCQPFKYPTEETAVEINIQNITNEAEEMDLDNTSDAPMKLDLKGNTSQASDPTPDSPVDVNVVSGDNTIEICGKNLFDKDNITSGYLISHDTGVPAENANYSYSNYIAVSPNTSYTGKDFNFWYCVYYDKNKNYINYITANSGNFTTPSNAKYIRFSLLTSNKDTALLVKGNTLGEYEAYTGQSQLISLGDIELNKISTYQDYIYKDNDRWYLHKEIGKDIISSNMQLYGNYGDDNKPLYYWDSDINHYKDNGICNKFTLYAYSSSPTSMPNNNFRTQNLSSSTRYYFRYDGIADLTAFNTEIASNPLVIYYVLSTPTDTEITDTTLISQLNNLANARSYDTSTHITQNANDKPFMLNATAVQKGTDTATVDNDGNIYSKPTLDIEGNGIVAIYLNGNQMFSVDLSNSSECIIDVTNLEAYDPETNELMNRQVTGDYSKFILPVGENTVKVSGNVTKATITDYVRWL